MEETLILKAPYVRVTNRRVVFKKDEYPLSSIVSARIHFQANRGLGILFAISGLGMTFFFPICGIPMFLAGLIIAVNGNENTIKLNTQGGEVDAFKTSDGAFAERIIEAINQAIAQKGATSSMEAIPQIQTGTADRLKKLDALLANGLITQDEWNRRRAEIIASI